MKKIVLTFGLIAGAMLSVMMVATIPFMHRIGFDKGLVIGYTTMVLAFLLVFFGIRAYRDTVGGGAIGFGRGFAVGALIALIASVCYTATWEVLYFNFLPDFNAKYEQYEVARARERGAGEAELARTRDEMRKMGERLQNPLFNSAMTFIEPLPVGLLIAAVSAGILRRKRSAPQGEPLPRRTVSA